MAEKRLFVDVRAFVFLLLLAPTAALAEVSDRSPRDRLFFSYHNFHNVYEAVQIQLGVRSPGSAIKGNTMITHVWTVRDAGGEIMGRFKTAAPAAGYAEVTFAVSVDGGDWNLFANDQRLGKIKLNSRFSRVSYMIEVERPNAGRNPRTGETINIPARAVPSASISVFDLSTGETKARSDVVTSYHSRPYYGLNKLSP